MYIPIEQKIPIHLGVTYNLFVQHMLTFIMFHFQGLEKEIFY